VKPTGSYRDPPQKIFFQKNTRQLVAAGLVSITKALLCGNTSNTVLDYKNSDHAYSHKLMSHSETP
jgi:hypothetical protein